MLIEGGITVVSPAWEVSEPQAPGFVRAYWVHGGTAEYRDGLGGRLLAPGHIYLFPSAAPYWMRTRAEDPLYCTFIHLDIQPLRLVRLLDRGPEDPLCLPVFQAIREAYRRGYPETAAGAAAALEAYGAESGLLEKPDPQIAALCAYMADHFAEPLTVAGLSAQFGYNDQYFIRLFRRGVGSTPHQYLLQLRLREAVRLLQGDAPIYAIAARVGFRDGETFCRAFKRRYGLSPGMYRKTKEPTP